MTSPAAPTSAWTRAWSGACSYGSDRLTIWHARARRLARVRTRTPGARRSTRARLVLLATALFVVFLPTSIAWADPGDGASNSWLSAFTTEDSHGIPMSAYRLSVDEGGVTNPKNAIGSFFLLFLWDTYRIWVGIGLWLFDFAISFKILEVIRVPANAVASALQHTIEQIGIIPTVGTLALCICGTWIMRGKAGSGLSGVLVALFMGSLLTSAIVKPVDTLTGEDGAIMSARNLGISLSSQVVTAGESTSSDPAELQKHSTAKLVDVFVRAPHGLTNYGVSVDAKGEETCADSDEKILDVYNADLTHDEGKGYPVNGGDDDRPRKNMGKCDQAYVDTADNPLNGLIGIFYLAPAGGLLVLFFAALVVVLGVITAFAVFEATRAAWTMLCAIVPGSGSRGIFESLLIVGLTLVMIIACLFGIGAFLIFFEALMNTEGVDVRLKYMLIDGALIAATVVLIGHMFRVRKRGKKLGQNVQKKVMPAARKVDTSKVSALQVARSAAAPVSSLMASRKLAGAASAPGGLAGPAAGGPVGGPAGRPSPGAAATTGGLGVGSTAGKVAKGAWKGTKIGLASTVGAPVYAPRAAAALKKGAAVKRTEMGAKLAAAKEKASTTLHDKADQAGAFGKEYVHNLGVAGRVAAAPAVKLAGAAAGLSDPVSAGLGAAAMHLSRPTGHKGPAQPETHASAPPFPRPGPTAAPFSGDTGPRTGPATSSSSKAGSTSAEVPVVAPIKQTPRQREDAAKADALIQKMNERQALRNGTRTPSSTPSARPRPSAQSGGSAPTAAMPVTKAAPARQAASKSGSDLRRDALRRNT